jgi:hypothetical protein
MARPYEYLLLLPLSQQPFVGFGFLKQITPNDTSTSTNINFKVSANVYEAEAPKSGKDVTWIVTTRGLAG